MVSYWFTSHTVPLSDVKITDIQRLVQAGTNKYIRLPTKNTMKAKADNKPATLPVYFAPEQIAETLAVKVETVRTWMRQGKIKGTKVGHIWRIAEPDFYAFINKQGEEGHG